MSEKWTGWVETIEGKKFRESAEIKALEKMEKALDEQIAKDKKRIEEYDAKNFIFWSKDFKGQALVCRR